MGLILVITDAGRAALVNAQNTGTNACKIASAGFAATAFTPDVTMSALPDEHKRITTVAGASLAPDLINVVIQDLTDDEYTARGLGLYLDDGTLFAVYGQATPIFDKLAATYVQLQADIKIMDAALSATHISFGDMSFSNPQATESIAGKARIATQIMVSAGVDDQAFVTSKKLSVHLQKLLNEQVISLIQNLKESLSPIGKIELMPFRADQLPPGWCHANGDLYPIGSEIGQALTSLEDTYKQDWGIVEMAGAINLPNLYHEDGRAYFPRAGAVPGVVQDDAIRNLTGRFAGGATHLGVSLTEGAFYEAARAGNVFPNESRTYPMMNVGFDASRIVPTAPENRPLNISLVPAIYLGV